MEDNAPLDQVASLLVNPKLNFVTGESMGISISAAIHMTQGFGEEHPIADNKTEEGHALRTDVRRFIAPIALPEH